MVTRKRMPSPRDRRSDGERTHAAILDVAVRLASVEGVEGLTVGRLAEELGVSKSGVYAHFGSKEQLQLETVAAAQAIFEQEVMRPALDAAEGLQRLRTLGEAYLSYVEREIFPGGCFFAALLAEMDARSGPIHDLVVTAERNWQNGLAEMACEAQRRGEFADDVDAGQLAFELQACLELSNYHFVLFGDRRVLDRGRKAVAAIIDRSRAHHPGDRPDTPPLGQPEYESTRHSPVEGLAAAGLEEEGAAAEQDNAISADPDHP